MTTIMQPGKPLRRWTEEPWMVSASQSNQPVRSILSNLSNQKEEAGGVPLLTTSAGIVTNTVTGKHEILSHGGVSHMGAVRVEQEITQLVSSGLSTSPG